MKGFRLLFENNIRAFIFALIFGIIYAICFFAGTALDNIGTVWVNYNLNNFLQLFFISFFLFFIFLKSLPLIDKFFNLIKGNTLINDYLFSPSKRCFFLNFLLITIAGLPALLAYFPGVFTYDTLYQANFFINSDYIEINPVIHNLMIYFTLLISKFFNTEIWGVFTYTIFQLVIFNLILSYCMHVINKYNSSFIIKLFSLLFFMLYPTNKIFPLIATKDVLFCALVLLFIVLLTECILEKEKFIESKTKFWSVILTVLFMCLFRHNGFYAYLLIAPFSLLYLFKKVKHLKRKTLLMFVIPILLYLCIGSIKTACGIKPAPKASSLSVPLQQLGRVRRIQAANLSEQDINTYRKIIPPQNELMYFPYSVDTLKIDSEMLHSDYIENSLNENPKRFADLYIKWMKLYPKDYLDAFLMTNYGYWYIAGKYKTIGLHYYLFTYNRWNDFYGIKIALKNLFPNLRSGYDIIFLNTVFNDNFLLNIIFSIGYNTWFIFIGILIILYKRKYEFLFPLSIIIALFLSLLLGPIVLLRYVYQNFLIIPLLFAFCFGDIKQIETDNS